MAAKDLIVILILLAAIAGILSCDKRSIEPERPYFLALSSVGMPDTVWLETDTQFRISAIQAERLLHAGTLEEVQVSIENEAGGEVKRITLLDDGKDGDLVAKDGIFSRYFLSAGFVDTPGKYNARFMLPAGNSGDDAVLSHAFTGIAGQGNAAPELFNLRIPPSFSYDQKFIMNSFTVDVRDANGLDDVESVEGYIYYPNSAVPNLKINLRHIDEAADTTFAPETYMYLFKVDDLARRGAGRYPVLLIASDKSGLPSAELAGELYFVSAVSNRPPVLSSLVAPDTVVATGDTIALSVRASDPDGPDDILRVWFDSFLPNGDPAQGNPFTMYDDGGELFSQGIRSGDEVKGDGIFTLIIQGPGPNQTGAYRFVFQAVDKRNSYSNSIEHVLHVVNR